MAGLIYLLMGGDLLVRGSVALAHRLRVPPAAVAATVIGFGTSMPELVVAIQATLTGHVGLILGNVVGSNTANVLLVGGTSAVLYPLVQEEGPGRRNTTIMMLVGLAFAAVCAWGELARPAGLALLVGFALLMALTARTTLQDQRESAPTIPLPWVLGLPSRLIMIVTLIVVGLAMLPVGAHLLVESAAELAGRFGVSDAVIGLTVVAIGTSAPELSTILLAALERRSDVAIGTIIGSNTFNVLAIMGVAAALSPTPIAVSQRFVLFDLPVMLAAGGMLVVYAWRGRALGRTVGVMMIASYVAYIVALIWIV